MDKPESRSAATEPSSAANSTAHDPTGAADQAARQAAERLKSVADQLRTLAPNDGLAGRVADNVTSGIKQAAAQLQAEGFRGFIDDLVAIAKRYPMQTLLLGIGGGFLWSRLRRD